MSAGRPSSPAYSPPPRVESQSSLGEQTEPVDFSNNSPVDFSLGRAMDCVTHNQVSDVCLFVVCLSGVWGRVDVEVILSPSGQ